MRKMLVPLVLACLAALCLSAAAQRTPPHTTSGGSGEALLNLDNSVAVHGYDPTAYFNDNRAVKGRTYLHERLGGATYYFASWGNRYQFLSNAPKYQPQFGGYCATSMSRGRLEDINPQIFTIYGGKLYLFRDAEAKGVFQANPERVIREAAAAYFELARQKRERY